jgi:hypothetical protein
MGTDGTTQAEAAALGITGELSVNLLCWRDDVLAPIPLHTAGGQVRCPPRSAAEPI